MTSEKLSHMVLHVENMAGVEQVMSFEATNSSTGKAK
jgi:hypothetical protein